MRACVRACVHAYMYMCPSRGDERQLYKSTHTSPRVQRSPQPLAPIQMVLKLYYVLVFLSVVVVVVVAASAGAAPLTVISA